MLLYVSLLHYCTKVDDVVDVYTLRGRVYAPEDQQHIGSSTWSLTTGFILTRSWWELRRDDRYFRKWSNLAEGYCVSTVPRPATENLAQYDDIINILFICPSIVCNILELYKKLNGKRFSQNIIIPMPSNSCFIKWDVMDDFDLNSKSDEK